MSRLSPLAVVRRQLANVAQLVQHRIETRRNKKLPLNNAGVALDLGDFNGGASASEHENVEGRDVREQKLLDRDDVIADLSDLGFADRHAVASKLAAMRAANAR